MIVDGMKLVWLHKDTVQNAKANHVLGFVHYCYSNLSKLCIYSKHLDGYTLLNTIVMLSDVTTRNSI